MCGVPHYELSKKDGHATSKLTTVLLCCVRWINYTTWSTDLVGASVAKGERDRIQVHASKNISSSFLTLMIFLKFSISFGLK